MRLGGQWESLKQHIKIVIAAILSRKFPGLSFIKNMITDVHRPSATEVFLKLCGLVSCLDGKNCCVALCS